MQSRKACAGNVRRNPAAFREKSQAFHALLMRARTCEHMSRGIMLRNLRNIYCLIWWFIGIRKVTRTWQRPEVPLFPVLWALIARRAPVVRRKRVFGASQTRFMPAHIFGVEGCVCISSRETDIRAGRGRSMNWGRKITGNVRRQSFGAQRMRLQTLRNAFWIFNHEIVEARNCCKLLSGRRRIDCNHIIESSRMFFDLFRIKCADLKLAISLLRHLMHKNME